MLSELLTNLVLALPLVGAYGIFAIGIVLIYRASQMLNLAHGAMAMVPAYVLYSLSNMGLPLLVALPLAVGFGAGLGVAVERLFVARLRSGGPTAQTVGTVAALGLLIAVTARIYGAASVEAAQVFPAGDIAVGHSVITYGQIGLFVTMLVVATGLYVLIQRTDLGLMMRGTAESRLAASLMGVNPSAISALTWALGGATAALAGILLASTSTLNPYTLPLQVIPAFIAALIAGLGSLPAAIGGAFVVGGVQGAVPSLGSIGELQGAPQLFLALLAVVVMVRRGSRLVAANDDGDAAGALASEASTRRAPRSAEAERRRRTAGRALALVAIGVAVGFPFTSVPSSYVGSAILAASYAAIGISVVLLTGWVGQISLGHAALVGVGAYGTGHAVAILGTPFPLSLPVAAALTGVVAALLGAVALRVRGLYLAVATLLFSWTSSEFLFRQDWFIDNAQIPSRPIGDEGEVPYFDFADRRTMYLVAWAAVGIVAFAAVNMKRSKTGRAFFAVRGSEMAAASLGIDVMRTKLVAFAASGAIAGVAGNLIMTDARVVTGDQFSFMVSLFYVAIAVVGGLTSVPGAVAAGLFFAGLSELFFQVPALGAYLELVSAALLAVVLLVGRGGLAAIPSTMARLARALVQAFPERSGGRTAQDGVDPVATLSSQAGHDLEVEGGTEVEVAEPSADEVSSRSDRRAGARGGNRARSDRRSTTSGLPSGSRARLANMLRPWRRDQPSTASDEQGARVDLTPDHASAPLDFHSALTRLANPDAQVASTVEERAALAESERLAKIAEARAMAAAVRPEGERDEREVLVDAANITVKFGGLVAVNDASLQVREGEIVGLIGPNGAGKTTFFNAIAGYNDPAEGAVAIYGTNATKLPVHKRAQLGVARTFQIIQLFRDLTVRENLLVATHVHNPTGVWSHVLVTHKSLEREAEAIDRVEEVIDLLDLRDIADSRAGDLPFGVLRMVEVARALVTGFRIIMLDEPASGLDNSETDKLIEVLRFVRGLGVSLLLIEHDVRMVTSVSDYMYVLERGTIIAEGPPEDVQRTPEVIAAYLGAAPTDHTEVDPVDDPDPTIEMEAVR